MPLTAARADAATPSPALGAQRVGVRRGAPRASLATLALLLPLAARAASPVAVTDGWFRYITPQVPAGGYMRLQNTSQAPAALVGAASPACGMVMLHRTETQNGAEAMRMVEAVAVPPNQSVVFAPGGYHLMCMEPRMKPGQRVPMTLRFKDGQQVTTQFAVYGAAGKPAGQ
ncbi:MAG TPA: copper chaperone PCu(A)C [Acetobacteraceae bacterium]|nr:copper chaperone PCu(A)C [Acetobacteraceae bacterium]